MIDSLDLRNLWIPDFDVPEACARRVAREAEQKQFKEKYGERWKDAYFAELKRRDAIEHRKGINCLVYGTGYYPYDGIVRITDKARMELDMRLREVYGDQYEVIKNNRVDRDPRVAELLVAEAIRKGSSEELPDALLKMYHERIGGAV